MQLKMLKEYKDLIKDLERLHKYDKLARLT